jgi:hypothetical protein
MNEAEKTTCGLHHPGEIRAGIRVRLTSLFSFSTLNLRTKLRMPLFAFLISNMDYFAIPYSAQMLNTETPFSSFSITDSLS